MMQDILEEVKRRSAAIIEQTSKHFTDPLAAEVSSQDYTETKAKITEVLEAHVEKLQNRVDELYQAIDKLEQEHVTVDTALDQVRDLLVTIEDMPDKV